MPFVPTITIWGPKQMKGQCPVSTLALSKVKKTSGSSDRVPYVTVHMWWHQRLEGTFPPRSDTDRNVHITLSMNRCLFLGSRSGHHDPHQPGYRYSVCHVGNGHTWLQLGITQQHNTTIARSTLPFYRSQGRRQPLPA